MAGGGLKRDVELIFRGTDRATPTIKGVRQEVAGLTTAISEQIAAAGRGEGTIEDLARAYKQLQAQQGDVNEIVKLATAYDKLVQSHAQQAQKADELRAAEAQLSAQVAAAEAPAKRLINARDAAARKAAAAVAKEQELAAAVTAAGVAFEAAGGDARNFESSQEAIRAAALETARALSEAEGAMERFKAAQRGAAAAKASGIETQQFNLQAAGSGLPQEQIAFISQLENRIEALSAAMRENAAAQREMDAARASRAADLEASQAGLLKQRLEEARQEAIRLEQAMEFKGQASEIEANAAALSRWGSAADTAATTGNRLVDTVQRIIAPTQAAARSLDGINTVIDAAEAKLDGGKRRLSEYNESLNDLQAANAGLLAMARDVDAFRQQEAAVAALRTEFDQAQSEVFQLAAAIRTAEAPTKEMVTQLGQAETRLQSVSTALTSQTQKLGQLERALESAQIDVRNLAAVEGVLEGAAERAAAAQQKLRNATGGKGSFLGLNPNEMANLGFQINDIVVSLISGQNPLIVFAQQGAQIGQIIPGAFSAIAARLPIIVAMGAVLVTVAGAMAKVNAEATRLTTATATVRSMAEVASGVNPQGVADLAEELAKAGVSANDANNALRSMMADGLNAGQMKQFVDVAKDMAAVTGEEVPAALDKLRESFGGGIEAIYDIQQETGIYTEKQLELIETLFEQGRADEARAVALGIYADKQAEVAAAQEGPWDRAVKALKTTWDSWLTTLSNLTVVRAMVTALEGLAKTATFVMNILNGKSLSESWNIATGVKAPGSKQVQPGDGNRTTTQGRQFLAQQREEIQNVNARTAAQKRAVAVQKAMNAATKEGLSNSEIQQAARNAGAIFDAQESTRQAKKDAAAGRRGDAAARRRQRAAETAARQIERTEDQLQKRLEQLDAAAARKQEGSLEIRLTAIDKQYADLFRDLDEFEAKTKGRKLIGDQTVAQARAAAQLRVKSLKDAETQKFYEEQVNDLLQERAKKLDTIQDKVSRGLITPDQGLVESEAVIDDIAGQVSVMAQQALMFATALRTAVPNPALEAFIASMENAVQNNSGGQNDRAKTEVRKGAVQAQEQKLNDLIGQRNSLIQNENLLVQLGFQTRAQAQAKIEGHYSRTKGLIDQQVEAIRGIAAAFANSVDPAMQLYYQNLVAQLDTVQLQSQYINEDFLNLKTGIDQLLTTNILGFLDAVAQGFANLITGKGDVLDFLASIGLAFLDMIGKTLQGIAQLILQMMILKTVESITGIPIMAMLKLFGGGGFFGLNHDGGMAGQSGRKRQVSPLIFANAPRYHNGGIAGLAPNEVATVLEKNEEVLTRDDPRHRFNGGLSAGNGDGGGGRPLKQVIVFGDSEVAGAMAGEAGLETTLTHVRRNSPMFREALGI